MRASCGLVQEASAHGILQDLVVPLVDVCGHLLELRRVQVLQRLQDIVRTEAGMHASVQVFLGSTGHQVGDEPGGLVRVVFQGIEDGLQGLAARLQFPGREIHGSAKNLPAPHGILGPSTQEELHDLRSALGQPGHDVRVLRGRDGVYTFGCQDVVPHDGNRVELVVERRCQLVRSKRGSRPVIDNLRVDARGRGGLTPQPGVYLGLPQLAPDVARPVQQDIQLRDRVRGHLPGMGVVLEPQTEQFRQALHLLAVLRHALGPGGHGPGGLVRVSQALDLGQGLWRHVTTDSVVHVQRVSRFVVEGAQVPAVRAFNQVALRVVAPGVLLVHSHGPTILEAHSQGLGQATDQLLLGLHVGHPTLRERSRPGGCAARSRRRSVGRPGGCWGGLGLRGRGARGRPGRRSPGGGGL